MGGEAVLVGTQDQPPTAIMSDAERHDDENPTTSAAGEPGALKLCHCSGVLLLCFLVLL
jgi:hypothetical protein